MMLQMLESLYALNIRQFVWDLPAGGESTHVEAASSVPGLQSELYGFHEDEALARISVWMQGDEVGTELVFGKAPADAPDAVYVMRRGVDSVYVADREPLKAWLMSAHSMRDLVLFPHPPERIRYLAFDSGAAKVTLIRTDPAGWMIVEPARWRADDQILGQYISLLSRIRVQGFAGELPESQWAERGLREPVFTLTLGTNVPARWAEADGDAEAESADVLWVGALTRDGKRYVKYTHHPMIMEISEETRALLMDQRADPLTYRDRMVLSIPARAVRKLSLQKGDAVQGVLPGTQGVWKAASPEHGVVDTEALTDVLLNLANLRALRMEEFNPANLSAYGLSPAAVSLTVDLPAAEGIQKTLLLGFKAKTDGIYAMVQGQDLLFVLPLKTGEMLLRDLVRPKPDDPVVTPGAVR